MYSVDANAVVNELLDKIKQLVLDNALLKVSLANLQKDRSERSEDLSQNDPV
jgi:hypothetical protein